jgi:hypothetical protein
MEAKSSVDQHSQLIMSATLAGPVSTTGTLNAQGTSATTGGIATTGGTATTATTATSTSPTTGTSTSPTTGTSTTTGTTMIYNVNHVHPSTSSNGLCSGLRNYVANLLNNMSNAISLPVSQNNDIYILNQSSWTPALTLYNSDGTVSNLDYTNPSMQSIMPGNPYNGNNGVSGVKIGQVFSAFNVNNVIYSVDSTELSGVIKIKFSDAKYENMPNNQDHIFDAGLPLLGQFLLSNGSFFRIFNVPHIMNGIQTTYICITQSKTPHFNPSTNPLEVTQSWLPNNNDVNGNLLQVTYNTGNSSYQLSEISGAVLPTGMTSVVPVNINVDATTHPANVPLGGGPTPLSQSLTGSTVSRILF